MSASFTFFVLVGELVTGCRNKGLPAISAMVTRADTRAPGNGDYPMAYPNEAHDDALRMIAWANELLEVKQFAYPQKL